jgi:hypothetical protein
MGQICHSAPTEHRGLRKTGKVSLDARCGSGDAHVVDNYSWYRSSPQLVYQPKSYSLDQRPSDLA